MAAPFVKDIFFIPATWIPVRTPGGGGYGPPADRDPELVIRDRRRGYLRNLQELPFKPDEGSAS